MMDQNDIETLPPQAPASVGSERQSMPFSPISTQEARQRVKARQSKHQGVMQRIKTSLSQWGFGGALTEFNLGQAVPEGLAVVPCDTWPGDAQAGTEIIQGQMRFAGQVLDFSKPEWNPKGVSPGFYRALHGFNWLYDLRALGGDVGRRQARMLVRSWIEQCGTWHPDAWEPGLTGQRLSCWLGLYDFFCATADDTFRAEVLENIRRQARHLARQISSMPQGRERLSALKGLFYSGVCLHKGEARLAQALRLMGPELHAEILPDGGHVERNPLSLLMALRNLIDIRAILRAGAHEVPEKLQHAIDRMAPALRFFRHGDGGLVLFNGGREGPVHLIEAVLTAADARGRPLRSMPHSGYERLSAGRTSVWMDCGTAPDGRLGRFAHAAPLSFELSVGRDRMIVNCGAHPSRLQGWHKALGATAAHSTLTLENTNAAELREGGLGRQAQTITSDRYEENGATWVETSHDGYEPNFQTLHFRRIYLGDSGEDVRGEDVLEGPENLGFALRFHLHPNVQASLIQNGQAVLLALPSGGGWRFRAQGGGGVLSLEESIYCGRGDEPRRTQQIVLTGTTSADQTVIKWALQREKRGL